MFFDHITIGQNWADFLPGPDRCKKRKKSKLESSAKRISLSSTARGSIDETEALTCASVAIAPDWGQLAAHWDAPSAPWAHAPVQFSRHPAGPQEALAGQMHDSSCPKDSPIPARRRRIEIIATKNILNRNGQFYQS